MRRPPGPDATVAISVVVGYLFRPGTGPDTRSYFMSDYWVRVSELSDDFAAKKNAADEYWKEHPGLSGQRRPDNDHETHQWRANWVSGSSGAVRQSLEGIVVKLMHKIWKRHYRQKF
jgi:hypothetical protein